MPDLDALLNRIGLDAAPEPTLEGLQTIHRAYVTATPYEDLAVQLGAYRPLDVDELAQRIVVGRRGGYCFELNTVLAWILEQVGFDVRRHEGVVGLREILDPPVAVNHMALSVHLDDGSVHLADAGLGEGQIDATPLHPGTYGGPLRMGVETEPGGGWFLTHHPWGSFEGVRIAAPVVELDAFQPHHRRLANDPESSFVNTLVVQRPYRDRIETLRSRTHTVYGPGIDERRVLTDADDLAATVAERFGIDPGILGTAAIGQLWARAEEQHERWLKTQPAETR